MNVIEETKRSTLYLSPDGQLVRMYKDTGFTTYRLPLLDERGIWRGPHNKPLLSEQTFRSSSTRAPVMSLRRTNEVMKTKRPETISELASHLGVQTSTAWCYLTQSLEHWPDLSSDALAFVHPPLIDAFETLEDSSGSLKGVLERLNNGPLSEDTKWKMENDQYAQLRLVRLVHT